MRFSTSAATLAILGAASAVPFNFPLQNGFPMLNSTALVAVEKTAGGTLPNSPLPSNPGADGLAALKLIAFNEIFEVAYFTALLNNVTNGTSGYTIGQAFERNYIMSTLSAIVAQEELHATEANAALSAFGVAPIKPCEYKFPVNSFSSAIALAGTFTDLVLGTLQQAAELFSEGGSTALVGLLASIVGQEGEQEGMFRILQLKKVSSAPFLTVGQADFAYSAINQNFIVPGSCPNSASIPFKIFEPLAVTSPYIPASNTTVTYVATSATNVTFSANGTYLAYISGQNVPVVVDINSVKTSGGRTSFSAPLPFSNGFSTGLTIAAVVNSKGPFADANAVADATLFGPGLLEIY